MGNCESSQTAQHTRSPNKAPLHHQATHKFRAIVDHYTSLDQVQNALRQNGLESSNLILAVDFTKSNEWTGKHSFGGRSLHALHSPGEGMNPYEEAISVIAKTLAAFDDDKLIPCYGFGDTSTHDQSVFSFNQNGAPCQGLDEVLFRYRQFVPYVDLSGPTSFGPAIRQAMNIVQQSGYQYHILVIIADGQVTRSVDIPYGQFSLQEGETVEAIVAASQLPLSIIIVGVGDGPWDQMKAFDDQIPSRQFDNLQFVNFTDIVRKLGNDQSRRETAFALSALMEIPDQYRIIQSLKLLGRSSAVKAKPVQVLPPPEIPSFQSQQQNQYMYPPGSFSQQGYAAQQFQQPVYPGAGGYQQQFSGQYQQQFSGQQLQQQQQQKQQMPDMFICPITSDLMKDPVMALDGYTYEREAIEAWFQDHDTSPMTNQAVEKTLVPNHALRSSIMEFKDKQGMSK